eukprot:TRINITY_DN4711_c0_g1_i1.p1 TRINITY_DN4711_c0_g1~~TRINITY_DN4711_c0_g1_i1.p1  ORF type:complete len:506 (-),score=200.40 TRINITY_DN4711_c0_g1_i1:60-1577(-)
MHSEVEAPATFEGTGSFSVEPALPAGLVLQEDGRIAGCVEDPELFGTSSVHVVTLANSGGETTAEVTVSLSDAKREFFEYVDAHQSDYIQDLSKCVAIPSEPANEEALSQVMDWLEDYASNKLQSKTELLGDGVVGITLGNDDAKKTLCVYGHLDVKTPGSPDMYKLSVGDLLTGAGVSGAKGPLVAWLSCAEAYIALNKDFPVNLKFLVENSGVCSSNKLQEALEGSLGATFVSNVDLFCVSETNWLAQKPCLTYSTRGFVHATASVEASAGNIGSAAGGTVHEAMSNAATLMAAAAALSPPVSADTRADHQEITDISFELDQLSYTSACSSKEDHLNKLWKQPCVSILGMNSGATQPASHISAHMLPKQVSFEFAVRTVEGQNNDQVVEHVQATLDETFKQCASSNTFELAVNHSVRPFRADSGDTNYAAAEAAISEVYGGAPDYVRDGDTVAAASILADLTGKSVCLMPVGSAQSVGTDNMDANNFKEGIKVAGMYMENIAA